MKFNYYLSNFYWEICNTWYLHLVHWFLFLKVLLTDCKMVLCLNVINTYFISEDKRALDIRSRKFSLIRSTLCS